MYIAANSEIMSHEAQTIRRKLKTTIRQDRFSLRISSICATMKTQSTKNDAYEKLPPEAVALVGLMEKTALPTSVLHSNSLARTACAVSPQFK